MDEKKNILTKAALENLENELQDLKVVRRKEIAQKIKEAREQGDLSENAEYDAAKDEQRDIEARIDELENILKNAELVDETNIDYEKIHLGCRVVVTDKSTRRNVEFEIVSITDVNSREHKISTESPIGKALMGKSVGDEVIIDVPAGKLKYKIKQIHKAN